MATPSQAPSPEKQKLYEQIVDTLTAIFGLHAGYRPVHAKGLVCEGVFTASPGAASLSRAPHLQGDPTRVLVRFSDFTGIPNIPDNDPNANPRGLALKFQLADGGETDILAHSINGFPVSTAEGFLEFLQALAASTPDSPHPTPIEKFVSSHRAAMSFVSPRPTPASFATESFYAVNAVRFVNSQGDQRYGRYQIHPAAGEQHLTAEETAKMLPNFLFDELEDRLVRDPFRLKLIAQIASEDDNVTDGSVTWPDEREQIELGTIRVSKVLPDSAAAQQRLIFDPVRLVDGVELSDDPLPAARSAVYSISYARRNS
ncbi:MAG TPA: catalase family peroxidase [Candidatus Acidoferrum sp.]|nr:catalase family peroxidase [Candidatus Acidoferrum sp.]